MDDFACYLCADTSFSIEPVASLLEYETFLSCRPFYAWRRCLMLSLSFAFAILFDLAEISSSRVYFARLGDHRILRLSLRAAFWHYVDSLLKSFVFAFHFPVAQHG